MTRSQISAMLRLTADVIDALPEFVEPTGVTSNASKTEIHLRWDDFQRLFSSAEFERNARGEFLRTESRGVKWIACRPLQFDTPREIALPSGELAAAHAACEPILLGDENDD